MKSRQKGFTLIELLVSLSIMALVSVAAGMCIYQVSKNTERNSNHISAVLAVQNADQRISQDALDAQEIFTNLALPNFLTLDWIAKGNEYQVTYTLANVAGSNMSELRRSLSINGGANTTSLVAQNIDPDPSRTSCNVTNGALCLMMTATSGKGGGMASETRNYEIVPRPN